MNIYEQILAGLQTKFQGADAATLQRIASKKAEGVTDESKVKGIVESVTFSDVMTNYGDFRANGASVTAKKNAIADYEKQHNLKDGKPLEAQDPEPDPKPDPKPDPEPKDMATAIAAALSNALKPISDRLDKMEGDKQRELFDRRVDDVAKSFGIPEYAYKGRTIDPATDLNVYFTDLKQTMINQGYKFPTASQSGVADDKPGDTFAKWTKEGTEKLTENNK